MNKEFRDAILLVQDLLKKNGQRLDLLASAAAYSAGTPGASDVLSVLLENAGPEVFVSKDKNGKVESDAFERAAAGNQVGAMQWMLESGAIEKPYFKLKSDAYNKPVLVFPAAVAAATGGAFDALEFLVKQVPKLQITPLESADGMRVLIDLQLSYRYDRYKVVNTNYVGLMVAAIAVAKDKGADITSMVERFVGHLKEGTKFDLPMITMAIELGVPECVTAMLEAGGRIDIEDFGKHLEKSGRPISLLRAINGHVSQTSKGFEAVCTESVGMLPYAYADFRKRPAQICGLLTQLVELHNSARQQFIYARHNGKPFAEFKVEALAEQIVVFLKQVVPDALSPALLARAVGYNCVELARRLLDEGIDPNALPDLPEPESEDVPALARNYAPIQRCKSPEMIYLLHERGADVNLQGPIHPAASGRPSHQGNLLTAMLMNKSIHKLPEMIQAFVKCGGDLAASLGERTLTYYLNNHPPELKQLIKSIKTEVAVAVSMNDNSGQSNSAGSASRKRSASPL